MLFSMMGVAVMLSFRHKYLLVDKVSGERYCCDAEAWKGASEAVESCERASVPPCLSVLVSVWYCDQRKVRLPWTYALAQGSFAG